MEKHGENSMDSLENQHGAGAKFHGFHGEIPMLSMLAWDSKNCKITPHESMESME